MLNFDDILSYYPKHLHSFKDNILKEYLQHKILDILFSTKYSNQLVFLGGTSIRIIHNSTRFSEDLDFDNLGLDQRDFSTICDMIQYRLSLEGYQVEIKNVFNKAAYHCYIKFPGLLYEQRLSGHKEEKILIQLDAEPQKYDYLPDKFILNKFGIFRYLNATPLPLLLSQKICACLYRKRAKGRDFFDVVFLFSKTTPDFIYLRKNAAIKSKQDLIDRLHQKASHLDLKLLAKDIEPFLFDPSQKDSVLYFTDWLNTL